MSETLPPTTTALVINTRSRKAERFFFQVLDILIENKVPVDLFPVRKTSELSAVVESAIARGNKTIIIGGGDGTISAMIKYFVHKDITLGILPLGTANSFIKSLSISSDIREAIDTILHGKVIKIDIGKCNDIYFANAASFGFTTLVARNLSDGLKKYLGSLAYFFEGLRQALGMKQFELTVRGAKSKETFLSYQVIVANGSFYGPTALSPTATVNSGKLVLIAMKNMRRRDLALAWVKSVFGKTLSQNSSSQLIGESFTLTATPNQSVSFDGELHKAPSLHFSIVPESVNVLVPQDFKKKKQQKR
jgi:YegS/Rv2252/BmrU family lipid kinase